MSHHVTNDESNDRIKERPKPLNSGLSSKGGALVLRSVSLFLAGGRKAKSTNNSNQNKKCLNKQKMKENPTNASKQVTKLLETLKRDTHFSK